MKLTTIGLVIVVIGLALQVLRLERRVDHLDHTAITATNTISAEELRRCMSTGCLVVPPN